MRGTLDGRTCNRIGLCPHLHYATQYPPCQARRADNHSAMRPFHLAHPAFAPSSGATAPASIAATAAPELIEARWQPLVPARPSRSQLLHFPSWSLCWLQIPTFGWGIGPALDNVRFLKVSADSVALGTLAGMPAHAVGATRKIHARSEGRIPEVLAKNLEIGGYTPRVWEYGPLTITCNYAILLVRQVQPGPAGLSTVGPPQKPSSYHSSGHPVWAGWPLALYPIAVAIQAAGRPCRGSGLEVP
jgi:hypothetical protein